MKIFFSVLCAILVAAAIIHFVSRWQHQSTKDAALTVAVESARESARIQLRREIEIAQQDVSESEHRLDSIKSILLEVQAAGKDEGIIAAERKALQSAADDLAPKKKRLDQLKVEMIKLDTK